jgi:hypothetical protein
VGEREREQGQGQERDPEVEFSSERAAVGGVTWTKVGDGKAPPVEAESRGLAGLGCSAVLGWQPVRRVVRPCPERRDPQEHSPPSPTVLSRTSNG